MRPKKLSGEGTVSEAGMWSTSSVEMRGSCRYCLMSLVYSSSIFCGAADAVAAGAVFGLAFLVWAAMVPEITDSASRVRLTVLTRHLIDRVLSRGLKSDIAFQGRVSTCDLVDSRLKRSFYRARTSSFDFGWGGGVRRRG